MNKSVVKIKKNKKKELSYDELTQKLMETEFALDDAKSQISNLEDRVRQIEGHLIQIINSTTWKIFAPARFMVLVLKNFKLFLRPKNYRSAYKIFKTRGFWAMISIFRRRTELTVDYGCDYSKDKAAYRDWIKKYDTINESEIRDIKQHIKKFKHTPLISIIMPVYDIEDMWLREAIDSVLAQFYTNWELCIADDCSPSPHIKKTLVEYTKKDKRIKVVYRKENGHISKSSNSALELATGEFVALLDHDDLLPAHALYFIANEINNHPDVDMIYSDEDKIDINNERYGHYFKSDWNPDLFFTQNMFSHLGVYRKELLDKIGGFREGYEGSQDYDIALRCWKICGDDKIKHISRVLYHWRAVEGSTSITVSNKGFATDAGVHALEDYFKSIGNDNALVKIDGDHAFRKVTWPLPEKLPKVSIIIPTRNAYDLLKVTINSILKKTNYDNYEIIIVNNQSDEKKTLDYFDEIGKLENVKILDYNQPFNYSAINNFAAKNSDGELIALVNNDIEVISLNWLKEMVSNALRKDIGAVGAKLYYPNDTVQHAGVFTGFGEVVNPVAGHAFHSLPRNGTGYRGRAIAVQTLSAVTAACLVLRREIFDEVGGLNEKDLPVAFNDVDFCLRIKAKGYRNLFTPYAELYHHESATRGDEDTYEKKARFEKEVDYMRKTWQGELDIDPYFNPNLCQICGDFLLRFPPIKIDKPWENVD